MWNFRVLDLTKDNDWGEKWLEICEVYYNDDQSLMGYSKAIIGEETIEELKETLQRMLDCLNKPVIQKQDFHEQLANHCDWTYICLYLYRTSIQRRFWTGLYVCWIRFCKLWGLLDCYQMSFTIYSQDGIKYIQWFFTVDELINSMLANPNDHYHRN